MTLVPETAIITTSYLPLREFVAQFGKCKHIYIDTDEPWQKQTLRNRTYILTANGIQSLSVPVQHPGVKIPVRDIRISYQQDWIRVHKGAIASAYNTSPFFGFFRDELFDVYDQKPVFLAELNFRLLEVLFRFSSFHVRLLKDISPDHNHAIDLRQYSESGPLSVLSAQRPLPDYPQVFGYKFGFKPFLSVIDAIANTGKVLPGFRDNA